MIKKSPFNFPRKSVCIIPARMGSKRIPGKNIKDFHGIPIILRAIDLAKSSELFESVFVSTDCEKIASICTEAGARVPRLRPKNLAGDFVATLDVIKYEIEANSLNERDNLKDLCVLYPCTPLLHQHDLIQSFNEYKILNSSFCFSSGVTSTPISRLMYTDKENKIRFLDKENFNSRTQDLEEYIFDAGQFYWGQISFWYKTEELFIENAFPYFIDREKQIDIDTEDDWKFAEKLFLLKSK